MDASTAELALRAATAALALSASAALLSRRSRGPAGAWAALVVGGIAAFAVASARGGVAALGFLPVFAFNAWCVATPAAAWVLARMLFRERMVPGPRELAVVGLMAIVTTAADWGRFGLGPLGGQGELAATLLLICRGVALALLLGAGAAAVRHWRADLVESRRRARGVFVGLVMGVFTALAGSEFLFGSAGAPPSVRMVGIGLLCGLAFALLQAIARGMLDEVLAGTPPAAAPALSVVSTGAPASGLARRVVEEMAARQLWKRERLGIAGLAAELGTQEYLLRRAINRDLGYRNFNDFLHDYRLAEAARRLADPAERLPVLSIALDCGYGSIGPFNRAFKARFGVTPTRYRATRDEQPQAVSGIGATSR